MALRISVFNSSELQGTILALKGMDKEIAKNIRTWSKRIILPVWQEAVRANVTTPLEARGLAVTARVAISNQNVTLSSATVGKSLSTGGAKPSDIAHDIEFGADQNAAKTYLARSSAGREYLVRDRHTRRQFRPRNQKGYVVYPAAANVIPRIAALWVQTTVRTFYDITAAIGSRSDG